MLKKLIALLGALALLLFVCLYPNETKANITPEVDNPIETVTTADSSRSVLKLVHTLESNNQVLTKSASAVVIHEDDVYYYAITNYHVLAKDTYNSTSVDVYDYLNNHYQASIILLNQAQELISQTYDLGLIKFEKQATEFVIPQMRETALNTTILLTAVGYPGGVRTVTTGFYTSMATVNEFPFQLVSHNAEIANGNSGGGLFDANGRLVGINVAAVFDLEGVVVTSYAIPVSKVLEYLSLFNL